MFFEVFGIGSVNRDLLMIKLPKLILREKPRNVKTKNYWLQQDTKKNLIKVQFFNK